MISKSAAEAAPKRKKKLRLSGIARWIFQRIIRLLLKSAVGKLFIRLLFSIAPGPLNKIARSFHSYNRVEEERRVRQQFMVPGIGQSIADMPVLELTQEEARLYRQVAFRGFTVSTMR